MSSGVSALTRLQKPLPTEILVFEARFEPCIL
jgi:hypothetical protein